MSGEGQDLARELRKLERRLERLEGAMQSELRRVPIARRASARNLIHYIALRQHDLRGLQTSLSVRGLSSLGRSESCVMHTLLETSSREHESLALRGSSFAKREVARLAQSRARALLPEAARHCLRDNTREVLGPPPEGRHIYIMVTAPPAKEANRVWMVRMLRAGMNVLRINCAHEGEREWAETIRALRGGRALTGLKCRILMDLAGPKIRTGTFAKARRVATWKPTKDDIGAVREPAHVVISQGAEQHEAGEEPFVFVSDGDFAQLRKGDELRFRDARGKHRRLKIHAGEHGQVIGLGDARAYVLERAKAQLFRDGERVGKITLRAGDPTGGFIEVKEGDELVLTRRAVEGTPPRRDRQGALREAGVVTCTLPSALDHLSAGQRVVFDDGRIHAVVVRVKDNGADFVLRVVRTQKETVKLRAEKGINLPDTRVTLPSLTKADRDALAFVAKHADAVSLSFVRKPEDVRLLHAALRRLGQPRMAIVLKIEKREAFENLPSLLLESLRRPPLAVMIARGDLAVEVGFERLAELQEEILWLCEAAHIPAIWATQVLDTLARTGSPSRAEVTDAAASVTAECVMLNKGAFVDEAVRMLSDILGRMEKHHDKKRSLFRRLRVSTFGDRTVASGDG
jgi:pyruvate kinase